MMPRVLRKRMYRVQRVSVVNSCITIVAWTLVSDIKRRDLPIHVLVHGFLSSTPPAVSLLSFYLFDGLLVVIMLAMIFPHLNFSKHFPFVSIRGKKCILVCLTL